MPATWEFYFPPFFPPHEEDREEKKKNKSIHCMLTEHTVVLFYALIRCRDFPTPPFAHPHPKEEANKINLVTTALTVPQYTVHAV